jgi:leader peptidase (prepilin peptidase)/N-methyltransferase
VVPNDVVLPAVVAALAARTALSPSPEWILAAAAAGGFLLAGALLSPSGLGMGDVKLGLLLGAALGRSVLAALLVAFALLLVGAVVLVARGGRGGLKTMLPFAPFLAAGGVAALLLRGG